MSCHQTTNFAQMSTKFLGHKKGDFPVSDAHVEKIITFPCDQHLDQSQLDFIIDTVTDYYG